MIIDLLRQMKIAVIILLTMTVLTGLIYPILVTLIAQLFFPWKSNGSFLENNGEKIGSVLIGQSFEEPNYFWGRPSATLPFPYNPSHSTGSNLALSNPKFLLNVNYFITKLAPTNNRLIPIELVTTSASGLDPHISPEAAYFQIPRISKNRGMTENELKKLIDQTIEFRTLGILGEPCVNVLKLNLLLDRKIRDKISA